MNSSAMQSPSVIESALEREDTMGHKHAEMDNELRKILEQRKAEIKVVGVGGAGGNTISRLIQIGIVGAESVAVLRLG